MMPTREQIDAAEFALDERLVEIRTLMFEGWAKGCDEIEFVAILIRTAYSQGLTDALTDPSGTRKWFRNFGFPVPAPKKGKSRAH